VTTIGILARLSAAYDVVRGRVPFGKAEPKPFWFGAFARNSGNYPSNQRSRHMVERLRRYSETPIVRRLIGYLRNHISMLRWKITILPDAKPTKAQKRAIKKVEKLLRNPNPDMGFKRFMQEVVEEMCVVGIGPVEIRKLAKREINSINDSTNDAPDHMLWLFDGSSLNFYPEWDGSPTQPRYAQIALDGRIIPFNNSELMPFRYSSRVSTPFGLSPVESAITEIEYLLSAQAFAGRTAGNATPKKALWLKNLTAEQRNELTLYWQSEIEGSASIPFLGGEDVASIELGNQNNQSLFLKWQEFLVAVIANSFGIDVQKVNLIVGINRSTSDKMDDTTDEGAIVPLADLVAETINQYVMRLYGLEDVACFEFIYATALSDRKALANVHQVQMQAEMITIDEAREEMGMPPLVHPTSGEAIGKFTLTPYRAMFKTPEATVDGPEASIEEGRKKAEEAAKVAEQAKAEGTRPNGENSNNTSDVKSERGGNGVHGASKMKEDDDVAR